MQCSAVQFSAVQCSWLSVSECTEQFYIIVNWNGLCDNILTVFGLLREEKDFADVTLVTEDNQEVEAYKVILAALSPYF